MNRRSFIASMLSACAAPMALKGAGRTWKKVESLLVPRIQIINPEWVNAPFEVKWIWSDDPVMLNLDGSLTERDSPACLEAPTRFYIEAYPMRYRDAQCKEFIPPFIYKT